MEVQIIETPEGYAAAAWDNGKLAGITLPHDIEQEAVRTLEGYVEASLTPLSSLSGQADHHRQRLAEDMVRYFSGEAVSFEVPLDWSRITSFRQRVLQVVAEIPYGQCLSYGEIAKRAGCPRGARAVGGAVGSNPWLLVVPCHRVLAHNRGLGGFGCGLHWKEKLLITEGISYKANNDK